MQNTSRSRRRKYLNNKTLQEPPTQEENTSRAQLNNKQLNNKQIAQCPVFENFNLSAPAPCKLR